MENAITPKFMKERFISIDGYAPFTLGAPSNTIVVDRSVFTSNLNHGVVPLRKMKKKKWVTLAKVSF